MIGSVTVVVDEVVVDEVVVDEVVVVVVTQFGRVIVLLSRLTCPLRARRRP
jgi:hypothetical protein